MIQNTRSDQDRDGLEADIDDQNRTEKRFKERCNEPLAVSRSVRIFLDSRY